jgi:hypothetical protein
MNHPNVVEIKRYHFKKLALVFEFCDMDLDGCMKDHLKRTGDLLPVPKVKMIMRDILKGLDYVHSHGIMHRYLLFGEFFIWKGNWNDYFVFFEGSSALLICECSSGLCRFTFRSL